VYKSVLSSPSFSLANSAPLFTSHKSTMTGALVCTIISVGAFLFMERPMSVAVVIVHGLEHGTQQNLGLVFVVLKSSPDMIQFLVDAGLRSPETVKGE